MEKELANAKTEKEKAAIKEKYEAKIEKAESSSHSSSSASKPAKKPSTSGSSSSSGGSASKPQTHTHSWQPVYEQQSVPYTRKEKVYYYDGKYWDSYDAAMAQQEADADRGYAGGGSVSIQNREVTDYRIENVLVGYRCSCGATK